ncbi:Transcriptional regulatory protein BtsR [BD1-7 clade bacterium]|uniref:Transcriptional regulatory protein BtsR n=1 Tax=BD1-7 clade bacterium TaxID=2029982 RepID=A0A5S9PGY2_9GAMM|nr:Transcriptional regulatory protein BtsR [BD1-7 clade bacterium]CAA0110310.1 Transcriptional regulatory protein BtsR [BD1-7 clade bacterium]
MVTTAIVIDDETLARHTLCEQLECSGLTVLSDAENAVDGMNQVREHHPDLLFISADLPVINGFEALKLSPSFPHSKVVITSKHHDSACEALARGVLDYLLKPISVDRIKLMLQRCLQRHRADEATIGCEFGNQLFRIAHNAIVHAHTDAGGTVYLHTYDDGLYHKDISLSALQRRIPDMLRCHRQHLVRTSAIQCFSRGQNRCGNIELACGRLIPVSRRYLKAVRRQLS